MSEMLKTPKLAKLLGVSSQTIRRLVHAKAIPFVRINQRVILFDPELVKAALISNQGK